MYAHNFIANLPNLSFIQNYRWQEGKILLIPVFTFAQSFPPMFIKLNSYEYSFPKPGDTSKTF